MTDWIAPVLAAVATILCGYLAYRGSRGTDATDRLSKAAGLYSDYADKMEERVTAVEHKNVELEANQKVMDFRLGESEKQASKYKREARSYRKLITEVIQWITELLDWETRGYVGPAPHFTLTMVLSHLTNAIKDRESEEESESKDGEYNGRR